MARDDTSASQAREASNPRPDDTATSDAAAELSDASRNFWNHQSTALARAKGRHSAWSRKRRSAAAGATAQSWKRVTFSLPRAEAQAKAREFLKKYPKAAYWSEVESWRELPGDVIEFTMRRLPTAD